MAWQLLEAETRADLLADWADSVVSHKDLNLSGRLFARFLKEIQAVCEDDISLTVLERLEKVAATWGSRGNPAGLTFDQTASRFNQPDLSKLLKDVKKSMEGRRQTLTLYPRYVELKRRFVDLAAELRDRAYATELRAHLSVLEQELLDLKKARSGVPSIPMDNLEREFGALAATLRKEITEHDNAVAKNGQQKIYDALAERLQNLEQALSARWEEEVYSAEITAVESNLNREIQSLKSRAPKWAGEFSRTEKELQKRIADLRSTIVKLKKEKQIELQRQKYEGLKLRLEESERKAPSDWMNPGYREEIAAIDRDFEQYKNQRSIDLAGEFNDIESQLQERKSELRRKIARLEQEYNSQIEALYSDLSTRLDSLGIVPNEVDDYAEHIEEIDSLTQEIAGIVRGLHGPSSKTFEERMGALSGRAIVVRKKMEDARDQAQFRNDLKKILNAIEAIRGYEERQLLPTLESQAQSLFERSRQWDDLYKDDISRVEAALAAAKKRTSFKPVVGVNEVRALVSEGIGFVIYDLIRIMTGAEEGKWLKQLAESVHPYLTGHPDAVSVSIQDFVPLLIAPERMQALQNEFVDRYFPILTDGMLSMPTYEISTKLNKTFQYLIFLTVQPLQSIFWFTSFLERTANHADLSKQETLLKMSRVAKGLSTKSENVFLTLSVGQEARNRALHDEIFQTIFEEVRVSLGNVLENGPDGDWSLIVGIWLWVNHRDLFTQIQIHLAKVWTAEIVSQANKAKEAA